MKVLTLLFVMSGLIQSSLCRAVEMKSVQCWKGYNQAEQNKNEKTCKAMKNDRQYCSVNWNEHKGAVYDVCLMEAAADPKTIVQLFKGYRQSEQDANLAQCRKLQSFGTLCVSDWGIHKQAVYDVALMQ